MTGIAVCSESIIHLLYGSKWLPAVPFAMIACFDLAMWPIHTTNLQAITALGRSDVFLKLELIKKALVVVAMFSLYRLGVWQFVLASTVTLGPVSMLLNAAPNQRLLGYSVVQQLRDIMPACILALIMGGIVYGVGMFGKQWIRPYLSTHVYLAMILILQGLIGSFVYWLGARCLKLEAVAEFTELWHKVKTRMKK
jgi:O-antigen/teichoic acid export membrane protein